MTHQTYARFLIVSILSSLLIGCASDPTRWENRVVCTMDKTEAHVISKWWMFSIGSVLAPADAVVCQ